MFKYTLQFNKPSQYESRAWNIHVEEFSLSEKLNKSNLLQSIAAHVKEQVQGMIWMTNFNKPNQQKQFKLQCKDDDCSCVVTMVG